MLTLEDRATRLTGLEHADERGWLTAAEAIELDELKNGAKDPSAPAEGGPRWERSLPLSTNGERYRLPAPRTFRRSSVRGDFRLHRLAGGFCATWKSFIVGRDDDGRRRWRIEGYGKAVAVSPDGTRILASDTERRLAAFGAATGAPVAPPRETSDWVGSLSWTADGTACLASTTQLVWVLDPDGGELRTLDAFAAADAYRHLLSVTAAREPGSAFVCSGGSNRLLRIDVATGEIEAVFQYRNSGPDDAFLSPDGGSLAVTDMSWIRIHDAATLRVRSAMPIPGPGGVVHPETPEGSWEHWKTNPKLSPDGRRMLVNDGSGQLWLADATSERLLHVWPREGLDFVEDTLWLDARSFLAITNDGRVHRLRLDSREPDFVVSDLS